MMQNNRTESAIKSFNFVVDEFMGKMIKTFPGEHKLKLWYIHFKTSKRFNPRGPMEYIMVPLVDMGVPIMTKDERFFKKDEYVNFAEGFSESTGLVNIWDSTTPDIKESIWGYIQSIYVMGMNGLGETQKLREVLTTINSA